MGSMNTLARASGLDLRDWSAVPVPVEYITRQVEPEPVAWKRDGILTARAWPKDITLRDVLEMRLGGKKRLAKPDKITRVGTRIYRLEDREVSEAQRLMDRLCLEMMQAEVLVPLYRHHNVACNAGRSVLLNFMAGIGGLAGIQFFEIGTGAGTPAAGDTSISTPVFRKAITTATVTGNQVDESTFFQSTEGNYNITNAGLWGNGATSTLGSGTLFAHATYLYNKTSAIALTNDYVLTLQ